MKPQILQVSLIGLGAGRGEDLAIFPLDDEHGRLVCRKHPAISGRAADCCRSFIATDLRGDGHRRWDRPRCAPVSIGSAGSMPAGKAAGRNSKVRSAASLSAATLVDFNHTKVDGLAAVRPRDRGILDLVALSASWTRRLKRIGPSARRWRISSAR